MPDIVKALALCRCAVRELTGLFMTFDLHYSEAVTWDSFLTSVLFRALTSDTGGKFDHVIFIITGTICFSVHTLNAVVKQGQAWPVPETAKLTLQQGKRLHRDAERLFQFLGYWDRSGARCNAVKWRPNQFSLRMPLQACVMTQRWVEENLVWWHELLTSAFEL